MPMLNIYVSDETLAQLNHCAERDEQGRTPVQLAEDCVADAAIRGAPSKIEVTTMNDPEPRFEEARPSLGHSISTNPPR